MKKVFLILLLVMCTLGGCAGRGEAVSLFTREKGSGTRDRFVDTLDIYREGHDAIDEQATVSGSSAVMISAVRSARGAIGYISMAAPHEDVKTVAIDGVMPTRDTIADGSYPLTRDFTLVYYPDKADEIARDFLRFTCSRYAAKAIRDMGCQTTDLILTYQPKTLKGKLVIAGSASVAPLIERMRELYADYQPDVEIEIQQNDSSAGLAMIDQNMADIAMTSRAVKADEIRAGYETRTPARDGIVVIVHPDNAVSDLTSKQLRRIFAGEIKSWSELQA